jgi:hypothetical protein
MYMRGRIAGCAVLAIMATLTRETSVVFFFGVYCFEAITAIRSAAWRQSRPRLAIVGFVLAPFPLWREMQFALWEQSPVADLANDNLSWPFVGFADMIANAVSGASFGGEGIITFIWTGNC